MRPKRALGATLLALLASTITVLAGTIAVPAGASSGRSGSLRAATGDWEGTADGFPASFEVVRQPFNATYGPGYSLYSFEDLVLFKPASCPADPSAYNESLISDHVLLPISARGSLNLRPEKVLGGLTGERSARVRSPYSIAPASGTPGCQGTLTWHMHPAHRRAVGDGTWQLAFSDGESETFVVSGGGREARRIAFPNGFGCRLGGVDMFIEPTGTAAWTTTGTQVTLDFKRTTATGQMTGTAPAGSAGSGCSLTIRASLSRPAS